METEYQGNQTDFAESLIRTAQVIILVLDPYGRIVSINPYMEMLSGYSLEEVQGKDWFETFLPDREQEKIRALFGNAIRDVQTRGNVYPIVTRDGKERYIEWYDQILKGDTGGITGLLYIGTDITERREAEDALRNSVHQLRIITDALPALVSYVDSGECFRFINQAFETWFGKPRDWFYGRHIREVLGDGTYTGLRVYVAMALSGKSTDFGYTILKQDGSERIVHITFIPDIGDQGNVQGFFSMISDVTDQKQAEVIDRKRLQDAAHISRLSTMGEMATEIAHELNQPLTAIASYSNACLRMLNSGYGLRGDFREGLEEIADQAERAGVIIHRLRDFARKREACVTPVDVNEMIQEMLHLIHVDARWHKVKILVEPAEELPLVMADRILIEQVIMNLVVNAIEAMASMETGGRRLTISTQQVSPDNIEVSVADSGPGMAADLIEQVFDAFYTTKTDGIGMGLSISRSIIDTHSGRLYASVNPDGGMIFCFTLPVVSTEDGV